jgi:hypothetical protein
MMNERMQTKYMTVLEDMYLSPKFKLQQMRSKHMVSQYLITICVKLGYIEKTKGTWYRWVKGVPTMRHIRRIKTELEAMNVKKPKKRVVKLLWGLITYEV